MDTPHEGVLVNVGPERYTIIDEDDLVLLSLKKYWFDGKYVSSSNTTLHRDIMERRVEVDWTILSLLVIHLYGDPFDNRRSNLRWVDRGFELDSRNMLPYDVQKRGRKYRVRLAIDGETRYRTFRTRKGAMEWWMNTRLDMMHNDPHIDVLRRLNGMNDK